MIKTQRIYDKPAGDNSFRILIDRLWPRGLKKEDVKIDLWMKDIAPSNELRKWFAHDPQKWNEFQEKYFKELDQKKELVTILIEKAGERDITLLYGAKDETYNNAIALKMYLENKIKPATTL